MSRTLYKQPHVSLYLPPGLVSVLDPRVLRVRSVSICTAVPVQQAKSSVDRTSKPRKSSISIRQHTSAYVSIRSSVDSTSKPRKSSMPKRSTRRSRSSSGCSSTAAHCSRMRQHTSAYVSIRQHTSEARQDAAAPRHTARLQRQNLHSFVPGKQVNCLPAG